MICVKFCKETLNDCYLTCRIITNLIRVDMSQDQLVDLIVQKFVGSSFVSLEFIPIAWLSDFVVKIKVPLENEIDC